jgi:hypothetical protein
MAAPRVRIRTSQACICEKTPGFYSHKTFQIDDPEVGLKWLVNITIPKVKMLRRLYCFVGPVYNPGPYPDFLTNKPPIGPKWCEFLRTLSIKASGLEEMALYLDSEPTWDHWGPAVDLDFVRALGCLSKLRKLEIDGYFPKEWPQYLEERTGLTVWDEGRQETRYLRTLRDFQRLLRDQHIDD